MKSKELCIFKGLIITFCEKQVVDLKEESISHSGFRFNKILKSAPVATLDRATDF